MHVRRTRARVRLFPSLDHVAAPRALPACDAREVLEHRLVEYNEGRLIEVLPPAALGAATRRLLREAAPKPLALRAILERLHSSLVRGGGSDAVQRKAALTDDGRHFELPSESSNVFTKRRELVIRSALEMR